jgi:hypothetical protein
MDQLGLLALHHHDVVVRQTLAGLNYQLVRSDTLEPLPDYWASLLFKRLMGPEVLRPKAQGPRAARVYAHRRPDGQGFTLLLVNLDPERALVARLPRGGGELYAVTGPDLFGTEVWLNGEPLAQPAPDALPDLSGEPLDGAEVTVQPLSFTFATFLEL